MINKGQCIGKNLRTRRWGSLTTCLRCSRISERYCNSNQQFVAPHITHTSQPCYYAVASLLNRKLIQFLASLSDVLLFLIDCFINGACLKPVKEACSAIPSCHPKIEGYPVGQHPLAVQLLKSNA